jgi:hypothetical protein
MKRKRDPRRKKALELERDHRVLPRQGNKTFRKAWPLKKAKVNREVRRAEALAVTDAKADPDKVEDRVAAARSKRRRKLQKEGVVSLAEQLLVKEDIRLRWSRLMELNKEARRPATRRFKAIVGPRK